MPPGVPDTVYGLTQSATQLTVYWLPPTINQDHTPLVDLAGFRIYRNGSLISQVGSGVRGAHGHTTPIQSHLHLVGEGD